MSCAQVRADSILSAVVALPGMMSTSGKSIIGESKWIFNTLSLRDTASSSFITGMDELLEAISAPAGAAGSTCLKIFFLRSMFSLIASITRSASATASDNEAQYLIFACAASSFSACVAMPLRPKMPLSPSMPLEAALESRSKTLTLLPARAATAEIWTPMKPAPMTATFFILSMMPSLSMYIRVQ